MTLKQVRELVPADSHSVKNGVFTVRQGFYYSGGRTEADFVKDVKAAIPHATILESGNVWKDFRGNAPVSKQSHWFVKFTVQEG